MTDLSAFAKLQGLPPAPGVAGAPLIAPALTLPAGFKGCAPEFLAATGASQSLADGIREAMPPLDIAPLVAKGGCAFFREAITTGGKAYDQPKWNLTTLCATWLDKGKTFAHLMARGHSGYTPASTDDLWDRKVREKSERDLGWPGCGAIQAAGYAGCVVCPHFRKIKSPLNLTGPKQANILAFATQATASNPTPGPGPGVASGPGPQVTAAVNQTATQNLMLPQGFVVTSDGFVAKVEKQQQGGPPVHVKLFTCKVYDPWAQKEKGGEDVLNFTFTRDLGVVEEAAILHSVITMGGSELYGALGRQGVKCYPPGKKYIEEFLMAWLTKLHEAQKSIQTLPFGWWESADPGLATVPGCRHGFVYGGHLYKDDGTVHKAGFGDRVTREVYKPCGTKQPWIDAMKSVCDQKRPELDCIIASAFAAPLMVVTGQYSVLLSVWSSANGVSKSHARKVAAAVWAHPKKSAEISVTTAKSALHKAGELKNLPLYWDELSEEKALENLFDAYFDLSQGTAPGRLNQRIQQQNRADWQTFMTICGNKSFVDHIAKRQKTTNAGISRVFEIEIKDRDEVFGVGKAPGVIPTLVGDRLAQELELNHGVVGREYARTLGRNAAGVDEFTRKICEAFALEVKATSQERYWSAGCGVLLAGAEFANKMGATIDIPVLHKFLVDAYMLNRERRSEEGLEGGTVDHTLQVVTRFLKACVRNQCWTDTMPTGAGGKQKVNLLAGPPINMPHEIEVQWVTGARLLRIAKARFSKFLEDEKISARVVLKGLEKVFGATTVYAKLAGGTQYRCGQEKVITIPVPSGSPFEDQLFDPRTSDLGAEMAKAGAGADTGLAASSAAVAQAQRDLALVKDKT